MTQINFGNDLTSQLKNEKGAQAKRPLKTWFISPVKIGSQTYYLNVEKLTGLLVVTKDFSSFTGVFTTILYSMGFLAKKQRYRIRDQVTESVQYRYNPDENSPMIAVYKQCIRDHETELEEDLKGGDQLSENIVMSDLSLALGAMIGEKGSQELNHFCQIVNEEVPIKVPKPRANAKYCTIKREFRDPRDWQKYTGKAAADNPTVVDAIKKNNQKMITQFLKSQDGEALASQSPTQDVLDDYLNDYLLHGQIRLVTTNLALLNVYYWFALSAGQDDFPIEVFESFFTFLSHTGITSQSTIRHVVENMQDTLEIFSGNIEAAPHELSDDEIEEFLREARAEKRQAQNQSQYIYPERLGLTYEIKVTLNDFKPQMSREFYIAGDQPIANLQAVIIEMFHGEFEHMYDLVNEQTGDYFILPDFIDGDFLPGGGKYNVIDAEAATVSMLKKGDQLVFHYDYGDDWTFNVTIENTVANYVGYQPIVVSAQGYGIVEDIGGVSGLETYYRDYQHGQVDPDIKDWLGGQLIDLDKVDINELNHQLRMLEE
jgi:hypothetical protein